MTHIEKGSTINFDIESTIILFFSPLSSILLFEKNS